MPIRAIDRHYWQATLSFTEAPQLTAAGLAHLIANLTRILPAESGGNWEFPAMLGTKVLQLGPGGIQEQPTIAIGTNPQGWHVTLRPTALVVQQRQEVVGFTMGDHPERNKGEKWLPDESLPGRSVFLAKVRTAIGALPSELVSFVNRVGVAVEYAGVVDGNPGAWIAATRFGGRETPTKIPNGVMTVRNLVTQEFVELFGRRYVWNEHVRVGNWFGAADGTLLRDCAAVFFADVKTAMEEMQVPPWDNGTLPASSLPREDIDSFFDEAQGGLSLALDRVKMRFPQGVIVHE